MSANRVKGAGVIGELDENCISQVKMGSLLRECVGRASPTDSVVKFRISPSADPSSAKVGGMRTDPISRSYLSEIDLSKTC